MIISIFIAIYGLLSLLFCISVFLKQKKYVALLPVAVVALLAPVHGLIAKEILSAFDTAFGIEFFRWYIICAIAILLGLLETFYTLFRPAATKSILLSENIEKRSIFFSAWPWRILAIVAAAISFSLPIPQVVIGSDQTVSYLLSGADKIPFYLRLLMDIAILFSIENIYRYAPLHVRRSGRVSFIAFAFLAVFDAIFTVRLLLFSVLDHRYIESSIIAYGICIAAGLFGLIRYRMSEERIVISRAGIYSSLTFLLAGVMLLALGVTVAVIQQFGRQFGYFEEFIAIFSVVVFGVLAATSQWMRVRVTRFANKHFYRRKYDYRDQFFRLHQTYMAGDQLRDSVDNLLENLTHSIALGETFVFLRNQRDGNFYVHGNPGTERPKSVVITGGNPFVAAFEKSDLSHIIEVDKYLSLMPPDRSGESAFIKEMRLDAVFPIKHRKSLVGLLAIRKMQSKQLDEEDIELINVFTVSIGNVYSKYRILEERLELKQFESFHHVSSFIIHDIKNQVATLSLLTKNADSNMGNPEFQKSLIRSIKSCSANLQLLVDKLSMPVKQKELSRSSHDINGIASEVLNEAGLGMIPSLTLEVRLKATRQPLLDREAFSFILRNLVINALEAMKNSGMLTVETGDIDALPPESAATFGIAASALPGNSVYVIVADNGPGMSRDFVENRLFRPFSTTKDKGIGIGLYQCRVLIEKMGGKLMCVSQEKAGTRFCCVI